VASTPTLIIVLFVYLSPNIGTKIFHNIFMITRLFGFEVKFREKKPIIYFKKKNISYALTG